MTMQEIERLLDAGGLEVRASNGNYWKLRRNGRTQTWKTRPGEFRIPVKAGLRATGAITHESIIGDGGDFEFRVMRKKTTVHTKSRGRRIAMKVTKKSHPATWAAMDLIDYDSGRHLGRNPLVAELEVPEEYAHLLPEIEAALARLDSPARAVGDDFDLDCEFVTFCIGDSEEVDEIKRSHGDLEDAHAMLDAYFERF